MERSKIEFSASCTSPDIILTVCLDGQTIYHGPLDQGPRVISYDFDDIEGDRRLTITMSGKTEKHTEIDTDGNIIEDHMVRITDLAFDGIELGHVFTELAIYEHDFNGTGEMIKDEFYGDMGCNGTVTLDFTTPIYLWLLENM